MKDSDVHGWGWRLKKAKHLWENSLRVSVHIPSVSDIKSINLYLLHIYKCNNYNIQMNSWKFQTAGGAVVRPVGL